MSPKQPSRAHEPRISIPELQSVVRLVFRTSMPAMQAQLTGVLLPYQASAADLHMALDCLSNVLPSNTVQQNFEQLVQQAPALEIVYRYACKLASNREYVLSSDDFPSDDTIRKFQARYRIWVDEQFVARQPVDASS